MFTQIQLENMIEQHPTLCWGYYINTDKKYDFQSNRVRLYKSLDSVNRIAQWIQTHYQKSNKFSKYTSYGIKHFAEKEVGYVTNGEFIVAALLLDYEIENNKVGNVRFNFEPKPTSYDNEFVIFVRSHKWRNQNADFAEDLIRSVREDGRLLSNTMEDWDIFFEHKPYYVQDSYKYIRNKYRRELKNAKKVLA